MEQVGLPTTAKCLGAELGEQARTLLDKVAAKTTEGCLALDRLQLERVPVPMYELAGPQMVLPVPLEVQVVVGKTPIRSCPTK